MYKKIFKRKIVKRRKLLNHRIIHLDWVSASKTRNYILNDPLLDWLQVYGKDKGFKPDKEHFSDIQNEYNFNTYIMKQGELFEKHVLNKLTNTFKDDIITITPEQGSKYKEKYNSYINNTINAMKSIGIIYQPLIYSPKKGIWGFPDLLVRGDFLHKIDATINEEEYDKNLYYPVDIKFSSIKFNVANTKILNGKPNNKCYKAQLYIYNECLKYMQKNTDHYGFLLTRNGKLNRVDFNDERDKDCNIIELAKSSIMWYKDLMKNGHNWNIGSKPELYPNMCNASDCGWSIAKKQIAEELKEITLVWKLGVNHREIAFEKGVSSWDKCDLHVLGLKKTPTDLKIGRILDINKKGDTIFDYNGKSELLWRRTDDYTNIYIDFETVNNVNDVTNHTEEGYIFLIGIGYVVDGDWVFKKFLMNDLSIPEENKMLNEFINFIKTFKNVKLYHYSSAEDWQFKKALNRHNIENIENKEWLWVDLAKVINDYNIVMKGLFNYSLKSVSKVLNTHYGGDKGNTYTNMDINNGMLASVVAFKENERGIKFEDSKIMEEVVTYNELDCKSLYNLLEILEKKIK